MPRLFFGPKVKVALAWDSFATVIDVLFLQVAFDQLQLDLDLKVYDSNGTQVGYSGSWDNSYEIAEFAAPRAARRTRSRSAAGRAPTTSGTGSRGPCRGRRSSGPTGG